MRFTDMADEMFGAAQGALPAGVRLATAKRGGVTVTPSCRAVATRTPPGRAEQAGAAYNSSAMSVKRMVFPSFSANLPPEALFEPLRTGEVWEK